MNDLQKEKNQLEDKIKRNTATDEDKKRLMRINNAIILGKSSISESKPKTSIVKTKTIKR